MQGQWKNYVSGWNHKDTRRKKQTRKNFLKDKAKAVYRIFDGKRTHNNDTRIRPDVYRLENKLVKVFENNKTYQKTADVFKALVTWRTYSYEDVYVERDFMDGSKYEVLVRKKSTHYHHKKMKIYNDIYRHGYFDFETRNALLDVLGITWRNPIEVHKLSDTYDKVELDWEAAKKEDEKIRDFNLYNQTIFLYGKPINKGSFWKTYWNDGRRRKYGQKMAHSKDRVNVRQYISNEDWDDEVKTHCYSKSIEWYVS
jgi:hypothetical protein